MFPIHVYELNTDPSWELFIFSEGGKSYRSFWKYTPFIHPDGREEVTLDTDDILATASITGIVIN